MFSPTRTALYVAIGAMALAAGEASAGCKYIPNPPGSLVCASWIKGSEVCNVDTLGDATLISGTCSITGFDFFDGAEGASGTTGAYCASGDLPPGYLTCGSKSKKGGGVTTLLSPFTIGGSAPKGKAKGHCKHGEKHLGKHVGHDDACIPDITLPPGSDPDSFSADLGGISCSGSGDTIHCTASATVLPPPGSMCESGPVLDFTAQKFLATVEACLDGGEGAECDTFYEACTLNASATAYDCVHISGDFDGDGAQFPGPFDEGCGETD